MATMAQNGGDEDFPRLLEACSGLIGKCVENVNFRSTTIDRDDLIQAAHISVHRNLPKWRSDASNFLAYIGLAIHRDLMGVVKRPVRRAKETPATSCDEAFKNLESRELSGYEHAELDDEARAALELLTGNERRVVLRVAAGRTYAQIAKEFGMSKRGVESIVRRMRERLTGSHRSTANLNKSDDRDEWNNCGKHTIEPDGGAEG